MKHSGGKLLVSLEEQKKLTYRFLTTEVSRRELADEYGVSISTIDGYLKLNRQEVAREIREQTKAD